MQTRFLKKLVFGGGLLFAVMLLTSDSAYADCSITSVQAGPSSVRVGEDVNITVNGQGCNGLRLNARVLEYNTDKQVNNFTIDFPGTGTTAEGVYIFNDRDVGEGENKQFKVRVNAPGLPGVDSGGILVTGGSCELSNAYWTSSTALIGQTVSMNVQGKNCSGYRVSFGVYEDAELARDRFIKSVSGQFSSTGTLASAKTWITTSEWGAEKDILPGASRKFTFVAVAGKSETESTNRLQVYVTGESPMSTSTAPGPSGTPGASISYGFEIPNPLQQNDVIALLKTVANWLITIAIPIVVILIIYSGILFVTARGEPGQVTKAKEILKYALIGLAIILIGSGFVSLIYSILNVGTSATPSPTP